jgi:hypothetical protein
MKSTIRAFATVGFMASLAGCGGHEAGRGGDAVVSCSSFDQTRSLVQVREGDLQAVCDCGASLGEGYDQSKSCDGGPLTACIAADGGA